MSLIKCQCARIIILLVTAFSYLVRSDDSAAGTTPFSRFEYKHSLKGPYLTQKDGTIPFWELGGHAIAGDQYVRLTPSMPNKKGSLWTKKVAEFQNFKIEVVFRVSGKGRIGGDGMALWFVEEKPDPVKDKVPQVLGGPGKWKGMGLLFDSYDNDGKQDSPKISLLVSDGTLQYNHDSDGTDQELEYCTKDYRNRPYNVRLIITYFKKKLTVKVNNGFAEEDNIHDYETCFERENVELPSRGYFGMTAATGGVSDDHDVYSFIVHSLRDMHSPDAPGPSEEQRKKYEQEYEDYNKKLKDELDSISKEHEASKKQDASQQKMEDETVRSFRQIWEEQAHIRKLFTDLLRNLGETKQEIQVELRTLHSSVEAAKGDIGSLRPLLSAKQTGGNDGAGNSYALQELKDSVSHMNEKMENLLTRQMELSGKLPDFVDSSKENSCASPTFLMILLSVQSVILFVLFFMYLKKQESAKKFY